jgi:hypothetical protein
MADSCDIVHGTWKETISEAPARTARLRARTAASSAASWAFDGRLDSVHRAAPLQLMVGRLFTMASGLDDDRWRKAGDTE